MNLRASIFAGVDALARVSSIYVADYVRHSLQDAVMVASALPAAAKRLT